MEWMDGRKNNRGERTKVEEKGKDHALWVDWRKNTRKKEEDEHEWMEKTKETFCFSTFTLTTITFLNQIIYLITFA
jgi:hypothetical protein